MFRYTIHAPGLTASFCTIADTVAFLDKWRVRLSPLRVTAAEYAPVDEDDDGLTSDERECANEPPGEYRDELVRRIDEARRAA